MRNPSNHPDEIQDKEPNRRPENNKKTEGQNPATHEMLEGKPKSAQRQAQHNQGSRQRGGKKKRTRPRGERRRPQGPQGMGDDFRRSPLEEEALFLGRTAVSLEETEFKRFFLEEKLLEGIAASGYKNLTPLQERMILPLMERENVIAQVSSGSGKTAAYLIPLLHTISGRMGPRALIITPTRDLAIRAYNEVRRLNHYLDKRSVLIDPGSSIKGQAKELDEDPEIIIGTPGRVLDHMRRGNLKIEELDCLVLDEVDRLLDHGQRPDVEAIIRKIYSRDQTITLSSSISPPVLRLCRKVAEDAVELFSAPEKPTVEAVRQSYFRVEPQDKIEMIYRLIEREQPEQAIIFCRTKVTVSRVREHIKTLQGGAMELHMGIIPKKQDQIIKRFREREFNILVTTDTFTRDLDIENISHVINFDVPEDPEDYIFRIGRTARMKARGRAMTLSTDKDMALLARIESHIGSTIEEEFLPGMEPEQEKKPERPQTPVDTPEPTPDSKPEYFHGGWYRKTTRRRKRKR